MKMNDYEWKRPFRWLGPVGWMLAGYSIGTPNSSITATGLIMAAVCVAIGSFAYVPYRKMVK